MVKENLDRNFLVHELWKQGRTVDEISFETGIPRSTVGYYIRKFNQCAKSGKPIPIAPAAQAQNDRTMAIAAFIKSSFYNNLVRTLAEPEELNLSTMITAPDNLNKMYKALMIQKLEKELTYMGKLNRLYKTLMIIKLLKELQTVIFPTQEEGQAFLKELSKDLGQVALSNKSV